MLTPDAAQVPAPEFVQLCVTDDAPAPVLVACADEIR